MIYKKTKKTKKTKRNINNKRSKKPKNLKKNTKRNKKYILIGGGENTEELIDLTEILFLEFRRIAPQINTKTLSIFNPSITLLFRDNELTYYACVSRCFYYHNDENLNGLTGKEILIWIKEMKKKGIFDDDKKVFDDYIKHPGNIFNKWFNPAGHWGFRGIPGSRPNDLSMLTIFSINDNNLSTIRPCLSRFLKSPDKMDFSPSDGRIMNLGIPKTITQNKTPILVNTVYICGVDKNDDGRNIPAQANIVPKVREYPTTIIDPAAPLDSKYNGEMVPSNIKNKQALSRMQILYNSASKQFACTFSNQTHEVMSKRRDPFRNYEISNQGALANCISWIPCTEKNYVLHYFNYENRLRLFCQRKCMILQFDMVIKSDNEQLPEGMVFYFKEFDADVTNDDINAIYDGKIFETEMDRTWRLYIAPNSSIFKTITHHFLADANYPLRGWSDHIFRFSCTTPFIEIENSLFSVGHLKVNIFAYMESKLKQAKDLFGPDPDVQKIKDYYNGKEVDGRKIRKNHLCSFFFSLIKYCKENIWNNPRHGAAKDTDRKFIWKSTKELASPYYSYSMLVSDHVRSFLKHEGIVADAEDHFYKIINNFHPKFIYFMFTYKINKNTLALESFSHPFMINKTLSTSFLMFPLGLTVTNPTSTNKQILLSYGDGDCSSYLASFTQEKFIGLSSVNNNDTNPRDIQFWAFKRE